MFREFDQVAPPLVEIAIPPSPASAMRLPSDDIHMSCKSGCTPKAERLNFSPPLYEVASRRLTA